MLNNETDFWFNWKVLKEELKRRIKEPVRSPTFIMFFIFIIIFVGGLGIWIPIIKQILNNTFPIKYELSYSMSTYSMAILASAFSTLLLSEHLIKALRMFGISVFIVGFLIGVASQVILNSWLAIILGLIGTIFAVFLWWIANFENYILRETLPNPNVATGGSPDETPLEGDLKDIKH